MKMTEMKRPPVPCIWNYLFLHPTVTTSAMQLNCKSTQEDKHEKDEDDFFDDDVNKFDAGLSVGAGITLAQHFYLGFAYEFGFVNLYKDEDDVKAKNRNWMFSVGYNF